jgi:hypothetical protein
MERKIASTYVTHRKVEELKSLKIQDIIKSYPHYVSAVKDEVSKAVWSMFSKAQTKDPEATKALHDQLAKDALDKSRLGKVLRAMSDATIGSGLIFLVATYKGSQAITEEPLVYGGHGAKGAFFVEEAAGLEAFVLKMESASKSLTISPYPLVGEKFTGNKSPEERFKDNYYGGKGRLKSEPERTSKEDVYETLEGQSPVDHFYVPPGPWKGDPTSKMKDLIKLAYENPELRKALLPIITGKK